MGIRLKDVWQFLQKDVRELWTPTEAVGSGVEISQAVLTLGVAMGVLGSPVAITVAGLSFVGLGVKGIQAYREKFNKEPGLAELVAIAAPFAYLQSLNELQTTNLLLQQYLGTHEQNNSDSNVIENLGEFQLDEELAKNALRCFHQSELGQAFNRVLLGQLEHAGMRKVEAEIVCAWVAWGTQGHLQQTLDEAGDKVKQRAKLYAQGDKSDKYSSIETYLREQIAKKPQEKAEIFEGKFSFQDIYVPLEVKPVDKKDKKGEVDEDAAAQNIEEWARTVLLDEKKQGQVLFIQGGPGRGKSVFCRMFADWVRRELHPIYTPILIRLRDITAFDNDFDRTLSAVIGTDFVNDSGWLTDRNTRFLFLLDGFDELLLERGANVNLRNFIEQVEKFQQRCAENPERQHRVLITGRPFALFGIEHLMPKNLERVGIILIDGRIQNQWLEKWQVVLANYLVGDAVEAETKTEEFREFLQNEHCPESVPTLAKEPLLLYLLAAMHRDDKINATIFDSESSDKEKVSPGKAKVLIYQKALDWVLNKQREDNLNQKLTKLEPEDLRTILAEAGLCVVQSGRERAKIAALEDRLVERGDEEIKEYIEKARSQNQENALKNALATFYLKSASGQENCVEFFHKSFGEFLCAERMVESLADWAEVETNRRSKPKPRIPTAELKWQIYDLLGYGALTVEIVEYVRALLEQQDKSDNEAEKIDVVALFERLHEFYLQWCAGEFIEKTTETLPQKKARQLQQQEIQCGQREVDIYTGLNVLILLLELHRYGREREELKDKVVFYPCGQKNSADFDSTRLLRIMGYSQCLGADTFTSISGNFLRGTFLSGAFLSGAFLSGAFLSGAFLSGADLSGAFLSGADLIGAYLRGAYLSGADLSGANPVGANLRGAILIGANLNSADLRGAYLRGAFLSGADFRGAILIGANLNSADLSGADLIRADLSGADLSDLKWDSNTRWSNSWGLDKARNVPDALAQEPQFAAAVALNRGANLVRQGDVDAALAAYKEAQNLDPNLEISAEFWNVLCRFGSLHDRASDVLFAGEKAVELEPDKGHIRDTRGLARALTGDRQGAIEDFQAALDSKIFGEKEKQQRQGWLDALRAGDNPFTPEVLAALHDGG